MKKEFKVQGEYLKKLRNTYKKSQGYLSRKLGLSSPQLISNIERGICGIPPEKILILSKIFHVGPKRMVKAIMADEEIYLNKVMYGEINENNE